KASDLVEVEIVPTRFRLDHCIPTQPRACDHTLHDLLMAHALVGATHAPEVPSTHAHRYPCGRFDCDGHDGFPVAFNLADRRLQARVSGLLDAVRPILQRLFPDLYAAYRAVVFYANEHGATPRIYQRADAFEYILVERGLELQSLGLALP